MLRKIIVNEVLITAFLCRRDDAVIAKHPYVQQRHIHSQMQLANRSNINRNVEIENLIPFIPRTLRPNVTQKVRIDGEMKKKETMGSKRTING